MFLRALAALTAATVLPVSALAQVPAPQSPPAPSAAPATPPAPPHRPLPAEVVDFFSGAWTGEGQFVRTGKPVASTYRFTSAYDREALSVEHVELPPATFAWLGLMTLDGRSGDLVLMIASNHGGGGRLMRSSTGWNGDVLVFEAAELQAAFARERLVFTRLGADSFKAAYEMSRDDGQTWRTGDEQTFTRSAN